MRACMRVCTCARLCTRNNKRIVQPFFVPHLRRSIRCFLPPLQLHRGLLFGHQQFYYLSTTIATHTFISTHMNISRYHRTRSEVIISTRNDANPTPKPLIFFVFGLLDWQ